MNKLYNFEKPFQDYDETSYVQKDANGNTLKDSQGNDLLLMMSKTLSAGLKSMTKGNIIKLDDWARSLFKKGAVVLDEADRKELKKIIETEFTGMSITLRRQLLDVLDGGQEINSDINGTSTDKA